MEIEQHLDFTFARHIDRILIRAYLYARLERDPNRRRPPGWRSYIENFCGYADLHVTRGKEALRDYLCEKFGLVFESEEEMMKGVDQAELTSLTEQVIRSRRRFGKAKDKEEILARNDALHVLRTYARRRELGERNRSNPYGYRTWWLTQETSVRKATGQAVAKHGALYMMRPEFLLNFIALSPSDENVRKSFAGVFPTLLGVKLSNRMKEEVFKSVMAGVKEAFAVDEARARVKLAELSNQLKGDFYKKYEMQFSDRMGSE